MVKLSHDHRQGFHKRLILEWVTWHINYTLWASTLLLRKFAFSSENPRILINRPNIVALELLELFPRAPSAKHATAERCCLFPYPCPLHEAIMVQSGRSTSRWFFHCVLAQGWPSRVAIFVKFDRFLLTERSLGFKGFSGTLKKS